VFEGFRILLGARGFVGGNLREAGNAFGLFVVGFRQLADLGLERAEQLEQLAFALFVDGVRAANLASISPMVFSIMVSVPRLTIAVDSARAQKLHWWTIWWCEAIDEPSSYVWAR